MNPWSRVVAVVGVTRAKVAAVAVVALFATAGLASLGAQLLGASSGSGITDYPTLARRAGDADLDGLPDVLENRLGSSPGRRDTLGQGVPDGWVYHWFRSATDWNDTAALDQPALVPPADALPEALQQPGQLRLPTLAELYAAEAAGRGEGTWWLDAPPVDPLNWDNDDDGIADAWLVAHGLRPWETRADQAAPGDPSYTLREKYQQGLDPSTPDTDGDGLPDRSEVAGRATFGSRQVDFERTDPLTFSTRGDGVPDGFLVRFGLDPHDAAVADTAPMPGGLTIREAYQETLQHCGGACDWADRLVEGPLVDPTQWDSNGDGVPDAWVVRQSHGALSPLDDARDLVLSSTEAWDAQVWGGDPDDPAVVVDGANARPKAPFEATLADYYARSRPAVWNETTMGPWWGGIPSDLESPEGALPPAVALRGWNVTIDPCRGCKDDAARAEHLIPIAAASDPRLGDSDGDGRSDLHEYLGWMGGVVGPRTNPFDADTDGDGLSDASETVDGLGTDPLRRDSSGGFLTDGEAYAYWSARHAQAVEDAAKRPGDARVLYHFLLPAGTPKGSAIGASDLERLRPEGMLDGERANLLNPDADGDGIPNGAELLPNTYLTVGGNEERPATDPARRDSDGDTLPDAWELGWSSPRYFVDCPKSFCIGSNSSTFQGWPLNPARYDSFDPSATELSHGDISDASRNLKGDQVRTSPTEFRKFRNDLAYRYQLSPFDPDSSKEDGIPDMFAIHWGIEAIPQEVRELVDGDQATFGWVTKAAARLEGKRPADAGTAQITHAVLDPKFGNKNVTLDTSLLDLFYGRAKGIWVFDPAATCPAAPPPASDLRRMDGLTVPDGCWDWVPYPLRSDLANGTNPWKDDFDDDGLPDAWVFHYARVEDEAKKAKGIQGRVVKSAQGGQLTETSLQAGCNNETLLRALPAAGANAYCLTYLQTYRNGLDPTQQDTDGGGLADWYEIALRDSGTGTKLNPLNKLDDHGEEDWDADGILNRVEQQLGTSLLTPDTDRDGLLDGDRLGVERTPFIAANMGGGDLCVRGGADPMPSTGTDAATGKPTGGMANRPGFLSASDPGKELSHTQVLDWYRSLGILLEPAVGNRCPQDGNTYYIAKREVFLDRFSPQNPQPLTLGAGGGSDSLLWDTTGGGVPDGWVVYWRDRAGQNQAVRSALDPTRPGVAQSNPDNDLPTRDEYRWGRPADWNEASDGPWWGGLNPAHRDSDGDELWFRSLFNGGDALDLDGDADGLPLSVDPYPDADHDNAGLIARKPGGGYATDFGQLWSRLAERAQWAIRDRDNDTVPDAIDRARVVVSATATKGTDPLTGLSKADTTSTFTVKGRVTVAEGPRASYTLAGDSATFDQAAAPSNANPPAPVPVGRVTVKVLLCSVDCSNGPVAVLGAGVTNSNGDYTITASMKPQATASSLPSPVLIHGKVYTGGSAQLPSNVAPLAPGAAKLWVMVEPNDPALQPLTFGSGKAAAQAFKDVSPTDGSPAAIVGVRPGSATPLRAARVVNGEPDLDTSHVKHAAEGVFAAHSSYTELNLRAQARFLDVGLAPAQPSRGQPLNVSGRLEDFSGVPLAGRTVRVSIGSAAHVATVRADGTFSAPFQTSTMEVGPFEVRVEAQLGANDSYLDPPAVEKIQAALSLKTIWGPDLRVGNTDLVHGAEVTLDPERPFTVDAVLLDAISGQPSTGRDVNAAIVGTVDGKPNTVLVSRDAVSQSGGRVRFEMPALPANTPAETLQLRLTSTKVTGLDEVAKATLFLNPLFPTRITVREGVGGLGERVQLHGHLERVLAGRATNLTGVQGSIVATFGDQVLWANSTDARGNFTISVRSAIPAANSWSFRFLPAPGKLLQESPVASARALHTARTALRLVEGVGTVDQAVGVTGRLAWTPADVGVYGQPVKVSWKGGAEVTALSDANGLFHAVLPAQPRTGAATVVMAFAGSPAFGPSRQEASIPILANTQLSLQVPDVLLDPSGATTERIVLRLENATQRLPGREVLVTIAGPGGANRTIERLTGSTGEAEVRVQDLALDRPGAWMVRATYAGSPTERAAAASGALTVTLRVRLLVDRVPAAAYPGDLLLLQGHLLVPNHAPDAVPFQAHLDGALAGSAAALASTPWSLSLRVPEETAPGEHVLRLSGSAPGIALEPVEVVLAVRTAVHAVLDVEEATDGSRQVNLHFVDGAGQPVERDLHLVLIRQGADGRVLGIHELDTTAAGTGTLQLSADEEGTVSVLQINDRLLALDSLAINTSALQPAPATGIPAWLLWTGAALGTLLAVGAALAYRAWRRSADQGLEAMLREARQALADPTLPIAEVIRRAYASLLEVLRKSGYTPRDTDTVRSITATVEAAFGLPKAPWRTVSSLFETAAYSRGALAPSDRRTAQQAFGALAQWWNARAAASETGARA